MFGVGSDERRKLDRWFRVKFVEEVRERRCFYLYIFRFVRLGLLGLLGTEGGGFRFF